MKRKRKTIVWEELGKFLIDIAKYMITAVIISSLLRDFEEQKILVYWTGGVASIFILLSGLYLIKQKEE